MLGILALVAWLVTCLADIGEASNYLYFEPTAAAIATADAAAGRGELLSIIIVLLAVTAAFLRRRLTLLVLALPGLVGIVMFAIRTSGHGAPLLALLAATLLAGAVAVLPIGTRNRSPAAAAR
jgi:hypothetical protein